MYKLLKRLPQYLLSILAVVMIFIILPTEANAASESDLTFTLNSDSQSYSVTDCNSTARGALVIPAAYNDKPVTTIGDSAFSGCNKLTSITAPDSIISVGDKAFNYCTNLTSITIGDSVTTIGAYAFRACQNLGTITIPNSVTSIGADAFRDCTGLTGITIGDSVTSIGNYAFSGCTGLTDVYITDFNAWCKISFSNDYANPMYLADCLHILDAEGNEVTDITFDDTVTTIPEYRFKNCRHLTNITISDNITSIGTGAFDGCTIQKLMIAEGSKTVTSTMVICESSLQEVVIPDSVTRIGDYAFSGCTSLTRVTIGNGVTSIGEQAFYGCTNLSNIKIPISVTTIGRKAFTGCTSLTQTTIGSGVTSIGSSAFKGCSTLTDVYITNPSAWCKISFADNYANPMAYAGCLHILDANGTEATGITFDDTITTIPANRFKNCKHVTTLTVSDKLASIEESAFSGCTIRKLIIAEGVKTINEAMIVCKSTLQEIVIPDSVTDIEEFAFSHCAKLTNITLKDGITKIGKGVFYYCRSLPEITIPDSVTSIGALAFYECSNLTTVTIGNGVTSIGEQAFRGCTFLSNITIPDSIIRIDDAAFYDCPNLNYNQYGNGKYLGNTNNPYVALITAEADITSCAIHNDTKVIAAGAFESFDTLVSVVIPDGVVGIGDDAFLGCYYLTSVNIPDSVITIGARAFTACQNLSDLQLSENNPCYSLDGSGVLFNKDKTELIFASAANMRGTYVMPDSVKRIDAYAFYFCDRLYRIAIPKSVTYIGESAFYGCYNLKDIWYGSYSPNNINGDLPTGVTWHVNYCGSDSHKYDYACDDTCNSCRFPRDVSHVYDDADDVTCNVCKQTLAPAAPTTQSVTDTTVTLSATVGYEYSMDAITWQTSNVFTGLQPATEYAFYQRVAAGTDNLASPASKPLSVETDKYVPDIPWDFTVVEITDTSVRMNQVTDCEYSIDGRNWQTSPVFTDLTPGTRYTFYQRIADNSKHYASASAILHVSTYSKLGTITYNSNGGQNAPEVTTGKISTQTPSRSGYMFMGWALTPYTHAVYKPGDSYSHQEDILLYADWEKLCSNCGGNGEYLLKCSRCSGTGVGSSERCDFCDGKGYTYKEVDCTYPECRGGKIIVSDTQIIDCRICKGDGICEEPVACSNCDETGYLTYPCSACSGNRGQWLTCSQCVSGIQKYTPEAPQVPELQSVSCNTVVLVYYSTCEYSIDGVNWQDSNVFSNLATNRTYHFYQRYKATDCTNLSAASPVLSVTTLKESVLPPQSPVLQSKTFHKVILEKVDGWEYSLDGINWQTSNVFDNLRPLTSYTFYCRFAETDTHSYSAASNGLTVVTEQSPLYNVVFVDWNGTVISSNTYRWGDEITAPANPTKAADNVYSYIFASWDKTVVNCAGDATYTATYIAACKYEYSVTNGKVTITRYVGNDEIVTIPSEIEGLPVTSVGAYAFQDCTSLTSVIIPDSVTSIGYDAFSGCSGLESITVPFIGGSREPVANSPRYSFGYIFGTTNYVGAIATEQVFIASPGSTTCTSRTFYIPSSLKSVTVTGGEIVVGAFYGCTGVSCITIGDGVTNIAEQAFFGCTSLTDIVIPDRVTSIGNSAFYGCTGLASATIGGGVTSIGNSAFYGCTGLTSITIGDGVTSIGAQAFYGCTSLTAITIPAGITSINDAVFSCCTSLASVTILGDVTSIGNSVFYDCAGLTSFTIPSSVISIGNSAFYGTGLTSITIPDSVTSIGYTAFADCTSLTCVTISDSVASVGHRAFGDSPVEKLIIADGAKTVTSSMVVTLHGLKEVIIPNSVTSIGGSAFSGCTGLTSITIPDSVTSIGDSAFSGCTGLTSIAIPNGVRSIGRYAFLDCTGLASITIPDSVTSFGTWTFSGCNIQKLIIAEGSKTITSEMVICESSLKEVTIPDSVTSIGSSAFSGCTGLTSIAIPGSVISIGDSAFEGCTGLNDVYIADLAAWCKISFNVSSSNPLRYAKNLYLGSKLVTELTIPDGVIGIGKYAFYDCTGLTSITIPDSVTSIGAWAFGGCSALTSIIIPDSVTTIEYSAFNGCSGINSVVYCGTREQWSGISFGDYNTYLKNAQRSYHSYTDGKCAICEHIAVYTVTFKNWNDIVLSTKTYHWGETVTLPTNPTRAADNAYTYTFKGWDNEVVNCVGNATYTATYTPTYINYIVVFKNWNGDVLSTETYHWGEEIVVPTDPTKAADNTYTYSFAGWDNEVVNCAGDATYTAIYTPTYINYTVVFKNWNGDVLSTKIYHWGEEVTVPADPTRAADNTYTYVFKDWDNDLVNCAGDATYTANYTPTYIDYTVTFKNWDGSMLDSDKYHYNDTVIPPANPTRPEDNTYRYTFKGWDSEVVNAIANKIYTAVYEAIKKIVEITSQIFNVQRDSIGKIGTGTSADSFVSKLDQGENVEIYKGRTQVSGSTSVGTGMEAKLMDGNTVVKSYTVIVTGDTNGDGAISVTDMISIKAHLLGKSKLTGAYAEAGDTSGDDAISITDFIQLKAQILGKGNIIPN